MPDLVYRFGPFSLDASERRLSREEETIPLRGKAFDTLLMLVENHGRLVRKGQLLQAVWPDTVVEDNNLDHNLSIIRKLLGQTQGQATYVETVPRQGYRFIAPVETGPPPYYANEVSTTAFVVEREEPLSQLRAAFERSTSGARQVALITGELGIGKTTLVRAFAAEIASRRRTYVARGECQKQYGEGEAYMPVLEALGRLAREDGGACKQILARHAPSWLAQLPSIGNGPASAYEATGLGITAERMLREMAEALEALSATSNLVLILDDLHWADYSTVDLLARIAQRTEPARLLIVGAYRPSEAKARNHPIHEAVQQLRIRDRCREIPLGYLTADGFATYLNARFGDVLPADVVHHLHARTQGNPLFLATVINAWLGNGSLRETESGWGLFEDVERLSFAVPEDLRHLIEQQMMELERGDQDITEAASAAGSSFSAAAIASALDRSLPEIEARCAAMAKNGNFFIAAGPEEWPDGTICESYRFLHSFHHDVVYERIPAGRRVRLHQQIAMRLEEGYRGRADQIAAELAAHFREARDAPRALHYLQRSAEQCLMRSAHREAIRHLTSALSLLRRLPELADRARRERDLLALLAPALVITKGFADPEAEHAFRRAYELCAQLGGSGEHFPVVFGLAVMLEIRGQFPKAQQLMEQHLPEQERCGGFRLEARDLLACSRFHQGAFKDALEHGEKGAQAYSPSHHSLISAAMGEDPGIDCRTWAALSLWFLGFPDRALSEARIAVSLAEDPSKLYSLANAQTQVAILHQFRQEEKEALEWANSAIRLATSQGYPYRCAVGKVLRGWALARTGACEEGIREIQEGMNACAAMGAELDRPYHLAMLAAAQLEAGRPTEAANLLDEVLARTPAVPAFFYASELCRLRGVAAMRRRETPAIAERWFQRAIETAVSQAALSLELRAELSLARLLTRTELEDAARERIALTVSRFTEGFDTPDLLRAAEFIKEDSPGCNTKAAATPGKHS